MTEAGTRVADGVGVLLRRGVRAGLYQRVVAGVHPAVTPVTYPVLSGVARFGPVTATDLGAELGLDRSFVSRQGAGLVGAGLLTATPSPHDRRATELRLTGEGERVVAALREQLVAAVDELLASWPRGDRRRFADLLDRFATSLVDASRVTTATPR